MFFARQILPLIAGVWASQQPRSDTNTVDTDVIVIGGGASGAHAAVRLTDLGQDVILVEKQQELGGAVDSYTDPTDGKTYNYGVAVFTEYGNSTEFFARFNISLSAMVLPTMQSLYADFNTGQQLKNYTAPALNDVVVALEKYLSICEKYENMIIPGFWNFPSSPSDIPEDLLMNFGDFVEKYEIQDALLTMWEGTALGVGAMLNKETLPVMMAFGAQMARLILGTQNASLPASGRNQDLYDAVAAFLGDRVYLNTRAVSSSRSDQGVTVTVRNEITGEETTIRAKKLLIAIQPVADKLAAFDLDEHEESVFKKIKYSRLYAGIASNPSLPNNSTAYNLPCSANDNTQLHWQDFNFTAHFEAADYSKDLFRVIMVGDESLGPEQAKAMAQRDLSTLVGSGVFPRSDQTELNWIEFSDHGPMHDRVSREDMEAGFYRDLYALQGMRSTWYTGGAFASNYQTILWEYNEILLPKMLAV